MKNYVFLTCLISILSFKTIGQKLTITNLTELKNLSLNNAETLLSQKKFEFKEVTESDKKGKDYVFSFNLDIYGNKGDEYLVLSFNENEENPFMVWYQLNKESWLQLKNSLAALGYKKIKTKVEPDGSLSTEFTNLKFRINFNSGKSKYGENIGLLIYTLDVTQLLN